MPAATVQPFLYDAYGRNAVYQSTGVLYRRSSEDDRLRPRPLNHFADYQALFSPHRYRELVSECRAIATRGLAAALLEQKSEYVAASGFRPRFFGTDTAWGTTAMAALEDALKICSLRGARFDWRSCWRMAVPTRATDGRFFVLLTQWESGWPALQFLEGHRVGQRNLMYGGEVGADDAATTITDENGNSVKVRGAYRGLFINNGIITNSVGTEVAYRVLGAFPEEDQDISARDLIHVASPQRYSEGCPVPDIARALMDLMALDTAQTCQLDQQMGDAKMTFLEENETGKQDPIAALAGMAGRKLDGTPTEMIERGNYRFLKSGVGSLKAFESQRPSDQWMNFDARVASRAAATIGWRVEMLSPKELAGGAMTRAFQDQINTLILEEFATIAPSASRVVGYFISKLIGLKVIPNSAEWMRWEISQPPWFEVDRASAKIDIEDVAAGRIPMSTLHARDGHTTNEVYVARAGAYKKALEVRKQFPDVPLEIILGDLGNTAPRTGFYPQNDPTPDPTAPQPKAAGNNNARGPAQPAAKVDAPQFNWSDKQAEMMDSARREDAERAAFDRADAHERHLQMMAALAASKPQPSVITVNQAPVHVAPAAVTVNTPAVSVAQPDINISMPEQKATVVNFTAPQAAPLPAPVINNVVNVPQQPPPTVNVTIPPLNATLKIDRSQDGKMTGGKIT